MCIWLELAIRFILSTGCSWWRWWWRNACLIAIKPAFDGNKARKTGKCNHFLHILDWFKYLFIIYKYEFVFVNNVKFLWSRYLLMFCMVPQRHFWYINVFVSILSWNVFVGSTSDEKKLTRNKKNTLRFRVRWGCFIIWKYLIVGSRVYCPFFLVRYQQPFSSSKSRRVFIAVPFFFLQHQMTKDG